MNAYEKHFKRMEILEDFLKVHPEMVEFIELLELVKNSIESGKLVWMIRKLAHEKFPHISMQDIIREIPVPGNEEWDFYLINLLHNDIGVRASANVYLHYYQRRFPEASEEMIMNLSIFKYIFRLLSNINIEKYPIMPFGEGITWTELSKRLLCIEQDYITGAKTTPDKLNVCGLIPDTLWENENIQN